MQNNQRILSALVVVVWYLGLAGCSGSNSQFGDEVLMQDTLTGTFASGEGLAGLITVRGAGGNEIAAYSRSDGAFEVDVSGLQSPYRIRGEDFDSEVVFYSIAEVETYTNINQLTTAVMRKGLGGENLETFYTGFSDGQQLSPSILAAAEEAVKQDLLVQILGNGVNPDELDIFRTAFVPNRLAYDAILDAVDDSGAPLEAVDYTEAQARSMLRILAKFFITDSQGRLVPNYEKLTVTVLTGYFEVLEQELIDQSGITALAYGDGELLYLSTTEAGRNIAKQVVAEIATAQVVEYFGQIVGMDEADIIFLQELASIPLQFNLLNAVVTMYRGLNGEDTSAQTQPLLDALEASSLGPDQRIDTARAGSLFFIGGLSEYVACELSLEERLESVNECRFRDRDESGDIDLSVDFDTGQLVAITEQPDRLAVQTLSPSPGLQESDVIVRDPVVLIRWAGPVWQGSQSEEFSGEEFYRQAVTIQISREGADRYVSCKEIQFPDDRTAECRFAAGQIDYGQSYTLSIVAEAQIGGLVSHVLSRFSTPDYPVSEVSVSPSSGVYDTSVDAAFSYTGTGELRYVTGSPSVSIENSSPVPDGGKLIFESNVTVAVAVFDGATRVSPIIRRAYVINQAEVPLPEEDPELNLPDEALPAPQNVELSVGSESLTLTWTRVDNAIGYAVYVSDRGPPDLQQSTTRRHTVSGSPFRIPDVVANTTYQVMVAAVRNGIDGDSSVVVSGVLESVPLVLDNDIDTDGDGLTDIWEMANGTNRHSADTDGDSIADGDEVDNLDSPLNTDGDALIDALDPDNENPCVPLDTDSACLGVAEVDRFLPLFVLADVDTIVVVSGSALPDRMTLQIVGGGSCDPSSFVADGGKWFNCRFSGLPSNVVTLIASTPGGEQIGEALTGMSIVETLPRLTGISVDSIPPGVRTEVQLSGVGLPSDATLRGLSDAVNCSIESSSLTQITLSCLASSDVNDQSVNRPELVVFRGNGAQTIDGSGEFSLRVEVEESQEEISLNGSDYYRLVSGPGDSTIIEFGISNGTRCFFENVIEEGSCDPYDISGLNGVMTNTNVSLQNTISENPTQCEVQRILPVLQPNGFVSQLIEGRCVTNIQGNNYVMILLWEGTNRTQGEGTLIFTAEF